MKFSKLKLQSTHILTAKTQSTIKGGLYDPITDVIMDSVILGPERDGKITIGIA